MNNPELRGSRLNSKEHYGRQTTSPELRDQASVLALELSWGSCLLLFLGPSPSCTMCSPSTDPGNETCLPLFYQKH